jgi:GT2 family glycosyltransferase
MYKITAVLTSFNRKDKTTNCLRLFEISCLDAGVMYEAILVDDGSTDGTADYIAEFFPWVDVIKGSGDLFWCRGMNIAMSAAFDKKSDYILWLNDDTDLYESAINKLLTCFLDKMHKSQLPIVVGSTTSDGVNVTYGGQVKKNIVQRFTYEKVYSDFEPIECDVMNGNVVLIPFEVALKVGNLDPAYEHAMGDIDYSLRAAALGVKVFVAPGRVGYCSNNSTDDSYTDTQYSLAERWKKMKSKKGLPIRSWRHFTHRHGGFFWGIYFVYPYIKFFAKAILLKK